MIKIFCDKCRKEIKKDETYYSVISHLVYCKTELAFCNRCFNSSSLSKNITPNNKYDMTITELLEPVFKTYGNTGQRLYNCFRTNPTRFSIAGHFETVRSVVIDICDNDGNNLLHIRNFGLACLKLLEDILCWQGLINKTEYKDYTVFSIPRNNFESVYGLTYEEWCKSKKEEKDD